MKAIRIKQIEIPSKDSHYIKQNMYSVYLGNGVIEYFSNLKTAKNFLAITNKFLNSKLHELNYIYTLLFAEYRRIWFYFDRDTESHILVLFAEIDKKFEMCISRCGYTNGNAYTFKHMVNLGERLTEIFEQIKSVLVAKKYYADVQRIDIYIRNIKAVILDLKNYSKSGKSIV